MINFEDVAPSALQTKINEFAQQDIPTIFKNKAYTTYEGKQKQLPPLLVVGCWRQDAPDTLSQAFPDLMEPFDLIPMPREIAEVYWEVFRPVLSLDGKNALSKLLSMK